jgi:DNA-directed RNA polymerase specialized sigma24 family protein
MANGAANDLNAEILARLDMLIRLQALSMTSRFESSKEKIQFLHTAGMEAKQIAELLHTSSNTVSVTLFKARRAKSAQKQKE